MKKHWRIVLPAVLGGLLLGVWLGARCERTVQRRLRREGPRPERVLKMLNRKLDLRPDQSVAIGKVLEAKRPAFDAVRREERERMKALRDGIDKDVSPILDESQKKKLVELRARWEKRENEAK
ncbi:MAG: hypothetical protein HY923_06865 [Elusimicrobia bacterium]|nr:hypothetical protein [Elusimicrobiota bacterium]